MATFRKTELSIRRDSGYGQYIITAQYRGKKIEAHTTDSEIFDYLDDDSNKAKHQYAKRAAYMRVRDAFNYSKLLK